MTRAGNAALDRRSKESMHSKQLSQERKLKERELRNAEKQTAINEQRAKYQNVESAAKATGELTKGAGNLGKFMASGSKYNHPQWYRKFDLDKVVAQLPTYTRLGIVLNPGWLSGSANTALEGLQATDNLPGVMTIRLISTLPNQPYGTGNQYRSSPVNAGLSRFMAELRKMNSRIGDYDASDFGLYWYAAADVVHVLAKIRQGIQIYNTYYATNRYFANALIYAIGFDANNFFNNIQSYKNLLVKFTAIFNSSIVIPANLTFMLRRIWLASALVRDHYGVKSQIYVFSFPFLGTLSEDETTVQYADYSGSTSYTATENYLTLAVSRLTDSIGMQTMMADLRAGIPENKFLRLDFINDIDKEVEFTDGEFNLEQIHNIQSIPLLIGNQTNWGMSVPLLNLNIHAMADGYIAQGQVDSGRTQMTEAGPVFKASSFGIASNADLYIDTLINFLIAPGTNSEFLNFYKPDVTEDDILEATRLRSICTITKDSANKITFYPTIRGTEVVLDMVVRTLDQTSDTVYVSHASTSTAVLDSYAMQFAYVLCTSYSRFDWCPKIRFVNIASFDDPGDIIKVVTHGEIDNYLPLSQPNLKALHEACSLSEFYIDSSEFMKALR